MSKDSLHKIFLGHAAKIVALRLIVPPHEINGAGSSNRRVGCIHDRILGNSREQRPLCPACSSVELSHHSTNPY